MLYRLNYANSRDAYDNISVITFDSRFDGTSDRMLLGILLPCSKELRIFSIVSQEDLSVKALPHSVIPAVSAASVQATRLITDLLYVTPEGGLKLMLYGLRPCNVQLRRDPTLVSSGTADVSMADADGDRSMKSLTESEPRIVKIDNAVNSSMRLTYEDGSTARISLDLTPRYGLVDKILRRLSVVLNSDEFMTIASAFLSSWLKRDRSAVESVQFECLENAILEILSSPMGSNTTADVKESSWHAMSKSSSQFRLHDDTALLNLDIPADEVLRHRVIQPSTPHNSRLTRLVLYALHNIAGELRVMVYDRQDLFRLAPLLCRIAQTVRPELVDYWKRVFPSAADSWLSLGTLSNFLNECANPD
jgi:anaphase-promoting complex subunit 1